MVCHRGAHLAMAGNDIQYTWRQYVISQFSKFQGDERGILRRFHNHCVAGPQRWHNMPHAENQWPIPGCNGAYDTYGFMVDFNQRFSVVLNYLYR